MARHPAVVRRVLPAGMEEPDATDLGLRVAAHCYIVADGVVGMAVAPEAARHAAGIPHSVGNTGLVLRGGAPLVMSASR